jgi:hypothetical protein
MPEPRPDQPADRPDLEEARLVVGELLNFARGNPVVLEKLHRLDDLLRVSLSEREAREERLELIARNAESWHFDEAGKTRALAVIAKWARGGELPPSLLAALHEASAPSATERAEASGE